jgi:Spy/CpxP family protein refolding chaperone
MSLRRILTGAVLTLGLVFTTGAAASAQQQQPSTTTNPQENGRQRGPWERGGGGGGPRHDGMGKRGGRGGMQRLVSQLNLTDAQQQQIRAIEDRFEASTKTQREEMRRLRESTQGGEPSAETRARFQTLREELGQAMKTQHQEMLNVLTSEQRAQLEQLMKERKARHDERRGGEVNRQNDDDRDQ